MAQKDFEGYTLIRGCLCYAFKEKQVVLHSLNYWS